MTVKELLVASMDDREWVSFDCSPPAAKVGDVVVAFTNRITQAHMVFQPPQEIALVSPERVETAATLRVPPLSFWSIKQFGHSGTVLHVRRRRGDAVVPVARTAIPDYPHKCTRCGGAAYVGLFEVVHERPSPECPARSR